MEIETPLKIFERGLNERGRVVPITLRNTGTPALVREVHVANLIKAHVSRQPNAVEFDYVANALDLCEDAEYATETIREVVFALSSPEANGQLSADHFAGLLDRLNRGSAE